MLAFQVIRFESDISQRALPEKAIQPEFTRILKFTGILTTKLNGILFPQKQINWVM